MSFMTGIQDSNKVEDEVDTLGGGGALPSDAYDFTIKMAYGLVSSGGAKGVNFTFVSAKGQEFRKIIYITSGTAKGCKTYYEKDGKHFPLPGFSAANAISLIASGVPLLEAKTERKVVKAWDGAQKKEVPTEVDVFVDLLNKPITLGLLKQIEDKTVKTSKGYLPNGEVIEINEIDKIFRTSDRLTKAEILAGATETDFFAKWVEKWQGKVKDIATRQNLVGALGGPAADGTTSASSVVNPFNKTASAPAQEVTADPQPAQAETQSVTSTDGQQNPTGDIQGAVEEAAPEPAAKPNPFLK